MEQMNSESAKSDSLDNRLYTILNNMDKPIKSFATDGASLLKTFLKSTKDWDGYYKAIGIYFLATSEYDLNKLIHSARVVLSRYRSEMRANGKTFRDFKFKASIKPTSDKNMYLVIMAKEASRIQSNTSLIEELL